MTKWRRCIPCNFRPDPLISPPALEIARQRSLRVDDREGRRNGRGGRAMRVRNGLATCLMMALTGVGCSGEPEVAPPPSSPAQTDPATVKSPEVSAPRIAEPTKAGETV